MIWLRLITLLLALAFVWGINQQLNRSKLPPRYWQMQDSLIRAEIDAEIRAKF